MVVRKFHESNSYLALVDKMVYQPEPESHKLEAGSFLEYKWRALRKREQFGKQMVCY